MLALRLTAPGGAQPWHGIWGNPPAPWPMLTEVLVASGAGGTRSPHVPAVCGAWQAMKAQLCSSRALLWLQPRLGLFTSEQGAQGDAEAGDTPKPGLKQLGACQSRVPSTGAAQSSGHVVLTQKPQHLSSILLPPKAAARVPPGQHRWLRSQTAPKCATDAGRPHTDVGQPHQGAQ